MHVYIVFAHPSRESFSQAVLEAFARGLEEGGHTFEVGDLYDMSFQSEMDEAQYFRELGLDPWAPVPEDVKAEQDKIDRADALVFIYPLWWSDCPAKLKGWFDRVLTYGYAYFYDDDEQRYSRITIEKALVLCSAGHTVEHLEETGIAESMRCIMLNDRLLGIGVKAAEMKILGGMMPGDDSSRERNLQRVYELGKGFQLWPYVATSGDPLAGHGAGDQFADIGRDWRVLALAPEAKALRAGKGSEHSF